MSTLYQSLAIILPVSGAIGFILLMVILYRGQICAGQRSRLSQQFATLWSLTTLGALSAIADHQFQQLSTYLILLSVIVGWSLSIKQFRLAGKRSLTEHYWWIAGTPLILASLFILYHWPAISLIGLLSGSALTHWLLVRGGHRLHAFDRILPMIGIIILALFVCLHAFQIWHYGHQPLLPQLTTIFIQMVSFALAGLFIWLLPLFRSMQPTAGQLAATNLCLVIAAVITTRLLYLLG
ncbi:hypothetical protein [Celerinatantimonas sp. YJH-8]|uniref:hypothetical protein n=1 Tax=Celerinatantimonas sp. YJH-8 TaxID=3228714 RepID=UPI0038C6C3F9